MTLQEVKGHTILVGENHKGMLKIVFPVPSRSHHVTAVQGGYPRLARVSILSLGTSSHAWHPRQPLGTALTTAPLKKHATDFMPEKFTSWQKKEKKKKEESHWFKCNLTPPIPPKFICGSELTSLAPSAESWSSCWSPLRFCRKGQGGLHVIFYVSFLQESN